MARQGASRGRSLKLNDSYADGLAQRMVLSGFALNSLGRKFIQNNACRDKMGPAVFRAIGKDWKRSEKPAKLVTDAARYFEEWFELRRAAQAGTLRSIIESAGGMAYLHGLDDITRAHFEIGPGPHHFLLLVLALRALEMKTPVDERNLFVAKAELASKVLKTISTCWRPNDERMIELSSLSIGGWGDWAGVSRPGVGSGFKDQRIYQQRLSFPVSVELARSYRRRDDIGALDFLLALAADVEPLPLGAHLRWAIDLFSSALAARCLVICQASPDSLAKTGERTDTLSFDAEGLNGLFEMLCTGGEVKPRAALRLIERLPHIDQEERELRGMWCGDTLRHGAKLFRAVMDMFVPSYESFITPWSALEPKLPPATSTTDTKALESALRAAEDAPTPAARLETFASALERAAPSEVRESRSPPYATESSIALGSEQWCARMEQIIMGTFEERRDLKSHAAKENRRPSREEYRKLLGSWNESHTDIRNLTPSSPLKDIRRALLNGPTKRRVRVLTRPTRRPKS